MLAVQIRMFCAGSCLSPRFPESAGGGLGLWDVQDRPARPSGRGRRGHAVAGLRCGRPIPVPAQHLAEPGVLRAAARRARQRAERGIPAGIRPVGHRPMGTLRRVLTGPFSRSTV